MFINGLLTKYGGLGRQQRAEAEMALIRGLSPNLTVRRLYRYPVDAERELVVFHRAGLPE